MKRSNKATLHNNCATETETDGGLSVNNDFFLKVVSESQLAESFMSAISRCCMNGNISVLRDIISTLRESSAPGKP